MKDLKIFSIICLSSGEPAKCHHSHAPTPSIKLSIVLLIPNIYQETKTIAWFGIENSQHRNRTVERVRQECLPSAQGN